jgi:V-type H+-transporting ATPase subunit a
VTKKISSFQAGEFFHSAESSARLQQREVESRQTGDDALDTPLLVDQVQISIYFLLY